jgi:tRNA pseudouridine55 synthase
MPTAPAEAARPTSGRDGLLLVDKPAGVSSHDVVLVARRAFGEKRIGHAGTLDPFATGLLVLLLGRATRLLPYLEGEPKEYLATVRFGAETDTEDLLGAEMRTAPPPDDDAIRAGIDRLTGVLEQFPPAYSAKRVGGKRAYQVARTGELPRLHPVTVHVHSWEVLGRRADDLEVRIVCGGGTYIRSLGRDLGRITGSAAHLAALRRTRSGPFRVEDAATLDDVREGRARLLPPLVGLPSLAVERLDEESVAKVARGIDVPATASGDRGALVSESTGQLVAVAERRGDRWQPRVVMRDA